MTVNAINGKQLSVLSAIDGKTLSGLSGISGQTIATGSQLPYTTNLVVDLESDYGLYSDNGVTPCVNNDPVYLWKDRSGLNHNAENSVSANRATYLTNQVNSLPSLRFNVAESDYMDILDHADLEMDTDSTVFIVLKAVTFPSSLNTFISKDNGNSAGAYYYYYDGSGKPTLDRPFIEAGAAATNGIGTSNYRLVSVVVSGTSVSHFLDGAANGTDTLATGTAGNNPLHIAKFKDIGTNYPNDFRAVIVIFNAALSTGNRESIEDFLGAKYGITITH